MKALMLGACLAAVLGAPVLAQPQGYGQGGGYDQGGGYQDPRDPYYDQGQTRDQDDRGSPDDRVYDQDRGYSDDQRYDNGAYDQDHDSARDGGRDWRGYGGGMPPGARFSGRVGASWRNAEGQSCAWRELTWQGEDGNRAYRWVQRCHY